MLAYRHGALSVVSPIIACEGAVIAVVSVSSATRSSF